MIHLIRTDAENQHFQSLVALLDEELAILDGEEHAFYNKLNKIDSIRFAVVAFADNEPVGCGAIREFKEGTMEVKRMYVPVNKRKQGIATLVLSELEHWAKEMHINKCILETGKRQPDAIALYKKCGYKIIPNFGKYANVENSVCFEKTLP
jgi:GNAT superfamily N-acetyltransferase